MQHLSRSVHGLHCATSLHGRMAVTGAASSGLCIESMCEGSTASLGSAVSMVAGRVARVGPDYGVDFSLPADKMEAGEGMRQRGAALRLTVGVKSRGVSKAGRRGLGGVSVGTVVTGGWYYLRPTKRAYPR